jgi:hypothetical protein
MYGGVPEKFPNLRIAFLECGCGWVPYWMDRMDEEWEKRQSEAPLLKKKPSAYMTDGNWFYATEPEERPARDGADRRRYRLIRVGLPALGWQLPYMTSTVKGRKDISDKQRIRSCAATPSGFTAGQTEEDCHQV